MDMPVLNMAAQASLPVYTPWSASLLTSIVGDALLFGAAMVVPCSILLFRRPLKRHFHRSQFGLVAIEFVLLLPILMSSLFVAFQTALIMQAKFVVNYAAFVAVRSAIVVLPASVNSTVTGQTETFNQMDGNNQNAPKLRIVQRAAALACAGISPPTSEQIMASTGTSLNSASLPPLAAVAALFPGSANGSNVSLDYITRAQYALTPANTVVNVAIVNQPVGSSGTNFALVTTRLRYRYYLAVPFAGRLLGTPFPVLGALLGRTAYYHEIDEQYTLPSEEDIVFPANLRSTYNLTETDKY